MTRKDICISMIDAHVQSVLSGYGSRTFEQLPTIMTMLSVDMDKYAIGGSIAAMLYGINIERTPHDIDIIVPVGMLKTIEDNVINSIFFKRDSEGSSVDDEWNTHHFAFSAIRGMSIDIIEAEDFNSENSKFAISKDCAWSGINVMSPQHLLKAKGMYNRPKDHEDILKLWDLNASIDLANIIYERNSTLTDFDEECIKLYAFDKRPLFPNNQF